LKKEGTFIPPHAGLPTTEVCPHHSFMLQLLPGKTSGGRKK